jgi:hypothetical protein
MQQTYLPAACLNIWICNIISPLSVDTLSHTPVHIYLLDKQSKGL